MYSVHVHCIDPLGDCQQSPRSEFVTVCVIVLHNINMHAKSEPFYMVHYKICKKKRRRSEQYYFFSFTTNNTTVLATTTFLPSSSGSINSGNNHLM